MSTGNDSILDAYLYETNTLLEQLDSIVLASEEKDTFSEEDINTIFRIMHTIKGSSAMMEYRSIMTIAHRAEDLFSIIRDKSMDIVPEANRPELFELLFQTIDFFRQEIDHIENGQPLTENIDSLLQKVNTLIQQIQNTGAPQPLPQGRRGRSPRISRQNILISPMRFKSFLMRAAAWKMPVPLCWSMRSVISAGREFSLFSRRHLHRSQHRGPDHRLRLHDVLPGCRGP